MRTWLLRTVPVQMWQLSIYFLLSLYVHCDIAGPGYAKKSWGHYKQGGATGFGIRSFVELLSK